MSEYADMGTKSTNWWMIAIFVMAFLVRVGYSLVLDTKGGFDSDTVMYETPAWNLATGKGITRDGESFASREPGYILFLAGIYSVVGRSVIAVQIVQALIGALVIVLIMKILMEFKIMTGAMLAGIAMVFLPEYVGFSNYILSESFFVFLWVIFVFYYLRYKREGKERALWMAGLFLGLATSVRSVSLFLPGFVLVIDLLVRKDKKKVFKEFLVLIFWIWLFLVPWGLRNYAQFGKFIFTRIGTGQILWSGSYVPWNGDWLGQHVSPMKELLVGEDILEVDQRFFDLAKNNWKDDPIKVAWIYLTKPFRIVFWPASYEFVNPSLRSISGQGISLSTFLVPITFMFHWLILLLAALAAKWYQRAKALFELTGKLSAYFFIIHMPLSPVPRYNLIILVLWLMLGSITAEGLIYKWKNKKS